MPEAAALERLLFWLRAGALLFLALGFLAALGATYVSGRLDAIRNLEVTKLREQLEQVKAAPRKQESQPAGRHITPAQHEVLTRHLQPYAGTRIHLVSVPEFEPGSYAHQLIKTLRSAGLQVRVSYFPDAEAIPPGVRAYWSEDAEKTGTQVAAAFEQAGVSLPARRGSPGGGAALEIHVGRAKSPTAAPASISTLSDAVK